MLLRVHNIRDSVMFLRTRARVSTTYSDLSPDSRVAESMMEKAFLHNNKFNKCILVRCPSTENALETFDCVERDFRGVFIRVPAVSDLPAHVTSIQPSPGWQR